MISVCTLSLLFVAFTTTSALGGASSAVKIDGAKYFDRVTVRLNDVFEKHTAYAADLSTTYDTGVLGLTLSECTVEKLGQVSHSPVVSDLYTDPATSALHPAFVTTYSLKPSQLMCKFGNGTKNSAESGKVTLTVSGLKIFIGVAMIHDGTGTYASFIESYAADSGKLESVVVSGKMIPKLQQAVARIYASSLQHFTALFVKSFDIIIAQEFTTLDPN